MPEMQAFEKIEERYVEEEASTLLLYRHRKTGAQILHMKNEDDNKVFAIGFRTPPLGSTGNCHILEHCVLNGSRKYKTREPFMDLIKSSLQTFLNAMTFSDKTVYPVASRNDADFHNLMDLYLDAVFYPRVKEDPRIFRQEGWHYELHKKDDPLTYSGVVYNEMKGATSSLDDQIQEQIGQALYPGTIYAENSGGDPYEIPSLTYERFIAYHSQFYHPSNALIFFYGNLDEEESFAHLNSYLDDFEKKEISSLPEDVLPFEQPKEMTMEVSLGSGEEEEGKSSLSCSWLVDRARTDIDSYYYNLLTEVLIESESSPLRRALLDELGCQDLYGLLNDVKQIGFTIVAKGVDPAKKDRFSAIIDEELKKIVEEGLDPRVLQGIVRKMEFDLREKKNIASKGIALMYLAMNEWLYGENPIERIAYASKLKELKRRLSDHGMEEYIRQRLLHNPNRVIITHLAKAGLNAKKDREEALRLEQYKNALSFEDLQKILDENKELSDFQNAEDSEEAKATIPYLSKEELPEEIADIPRRVEEKNGVTYLLHDLPTAGIDYLDLVFDLSHFTIEEAPYLTVLCELLGRLDTRLHSYQEYQAEEALATGGISTTAQVSSLMGSDLFRTVLLVSTKFLGLADFDRGLELIREQLLETDFSDQAKIREELGILVSNYEMNLVPYGHLHAIQRAMSWQTPSAHFSEALSGLSYFLFLKKLAKNYGPEDQKILEDLYHRLTLSPERLANIAASGTDLDQMKEAISHWLTAFPAKNLPAAAMDFHPQSRKEAFITTTNVQFVGQAGHLHRGPQVFHGPGLMVSNLVSNDFLYKEIRAKGGAYGQGMQLSYADDTLYTFSYRDPHLDRTLRVNQTIPDYLKNLSLSAQDLDRTLIGSIGSLDRPMTERQKSSFDLGLYLSQYPEGYFKRLFKEMKETSIEALRAYEKPVQRALESASTAVIGSKEAVEKSKTSFDQIFSI